MSRDVFAAGVRCGVCGELVTRWRDSQPDDELNPVMQPCGHTFADLLLELLRTRKRRVFLVS